MRFRDYFLFFETHSYEDFVASAKELGLSPEELIRKTLEKEHEAEGGNAVFRRIPNTNYGLKTVRHDKPWPQELAKVEDPFPGDNFGQPVASFGGDSEVLKLQHGQPAGHPFKYDNSSVEGVRKAKEIYRTRLRQAAEMPMEAYVGLMREILKLNSKNYEMDPSKAGNLLIDAEGGKFRLVDIGKKEKPQGNSADQVAVMLINNCHAGEVLGRDQEAHAWIKQILEKTRRAAAESGLPFNNDSPSIQYSYQLAGVPPPNAGPDWQPYQHKEVKPEDLVRKSTKDISGWLQI